MFITATTKPEEFLAETGWELDEDDSFESFSNAFEFFVRLSGAPIGQLNAMDTSSPWGPPSGSPRTTLFSWLQGVSMAHPVNPRRVLGKDTALKQFRRPSDPPEAVGDWFTWLPTPFRRMALPVGQTSERFFEVTRAIRCMECMISDAYVGWDMRDNVPLYRRGGGKQLFIHRKTPSAKAIRLIRA